ncbi:MAG TPA: serine/threonine-protein kinase [Candidatus Polarisedimenticolaceae bacterium]|nr:serine/threonine-protein kinase [Candidatus Polarisedimenticolaceae bacterium]
MPRPAAREVGRYHLGDLLGRGGIAEVYHAVDPRLHRRVAIKTIRVGRAARPESLARLAREMKLVLALEHPNILPVYEVGQSDGEPYLVMPLLGGGTLTERIARGVGERDALRWVTRLADALDVAHALGILHGDVKPSNVLFDRAGRPLLADFGLAPLVAAAGPAAGGSGYTAPELARGREPSPASDLYSLAALTRELLSSPAPAQAVIARALAEDPAARHRSCGEFAGALAAALEPPAAAGAPLAPSAVPDLGADGPRSVTAAWLEGAGPEGRDRHRRTWTMLLVLLFAMLGALLGARSLLDRSNGARTGTGRSVRSVPEAAVRAHLDGNHDHALALAVGAIEALPRRSNEARARLLAFVAKEQVELGLWRDAVTTCETIAGLGVVASDEAARCADEIARDRLHDLEATRRLLEAARER